MNGYIGISINPEKRRIAHRNCLRRIIKGLSTNHTYNKLFVEAFKVDNLCMKILHAGSQKDILSLEYTYRPKLAIGYNLAIGGSENGVTSQYKHGGSKDYADYLRFKKLINYCARNNLFIDPLFLVEESGYSNFLDIKPVINFINLKYEYILLKPELGFVKFNIAINYLNVIFVKYNNSIYPLSEVRQFSSVAYSTIKKRISKYGWTPEQACGFEPAPSNRYNYVILDGVKCNYMPSRSFTEESLKDLYQLYKSGSRLYSSRCRHYNTTSQNTTRFFCKFGLKLCVDKRTKEYRANGT